MIIKMLNEQIDEDAVVDALLSCGYKRNSYGEYTKHYTGFRVFVDPQTGDGYIEDNATIHEINPDLKPIDSAEKVEELDRLANTSWLDIWETTDQYVSRMSKDHELVNGVWMKKNTGYRRH